MFVCSVCKKKKKNNEYPSIAEEFKEVENQTFIKLIFSPYCYDCIFNERQEKLKKEEEQKKILEKRKAKLNIKDKLLLIDFDDYE